jgi:ATP-dependent helicase/DNAse subunit B
VDRSGTSARVVDYKTGKPPEDEEIGLDGGLHLQLPIYLLAAKDLHPGLKRAEAEYLYIGGEPKRVRFRIEGGGIEPTAGMAGVVGVLVDGIRSGRFFAHPYRESRCHPCRYASICGVNILGRFEGKKGDARIQAHLKIRGKGVK